MKYIRTSLQRTYINFQEWARDNNIFHRTVSLEPGIYGFVYTSTWNNYYIIINKNLTRELQKEVFCHEVDHIMCDMPKRSYIIGLDMQYSELENKADNYAKEIMEVAASYF